MCFFHSKLLIDCSLPELYSCLTMEYIIQPAKWFPITYSAINIIILEYNKNLHIITFFYCI